MRRIAIAAAALAPALWAAPPPHSEWKLTFSDEFDGPVLDASKWNNGYALEATGPGSWPDPANVRLEGGSLRLYGEKRAGQGKAYAGAAINNKNKFHQMYGYMEARIKVPDGKGFSGKMTGIKAGGGYPPWLDIIETRGEEPNHPYWYLHPTGSAGIGGGWNGTDLAGEFHTLGTEWNADELIFYVDGVAKLRDKSSAPQLRMEMCWALELMVGGDSWIGIPDASTPWPGVYEIDYVRIYGRLGPVPVLRAPGVRAGTSAGRPYGRLVDGRWWQGRSDALPAAVLCGAGGCGLPGR
jgi:beta-glucanase (GH16 family)